MSKVKKQINNDIYYTPKGDFKDYFEAAKSVEGTKVYIISKFKKLIEDSYTYKDLIHEADLAIIEAWIQWDPEKVKFNTWVHNMINWHITAFLTKVNNRFRSNKAARTDLEQSGETYEIVKKRGKTKSQAFNEQYGLDGSEKAKEIINKELYRLYVYHIARESATNIVNERVLNESHSEDGGLMYEVPNEVENEDERYLNRLHELKDEFKIDVAKKLIYGYTIPEIAAEYKLSKKELVYKVEGKKIVNKKTKADERRKRAERAKLIKQRMQEKLNAIKSN